MDSKSGAGVDPMSNRHARLESITSRHPLHDDRGCLRGSNVLRVHVIRHAFILQDCRSNITVTADSATAAMTAAMYLRFAARQLV
jgi:hypothetical protein